MNLRALGEFGLIGRIAEQLGHTEGVICGIGDDAAVIAPSAGSRLLITSDMLLEGVHFDRAYSPPLLLGRKSLAVNLSDLAAMGAKPRWFMLSLAIPEGMDLDFLDPFLDGLLGMGSDYNVVLVGGDTCSSRNGLVISITLFGERAGNRELYRSGAQPGDLICVSGTVGDAALGLLELRNGRTNGDAVSRHLDPSPRCRVGELLADRGLATAMIDISDGFLADLGHILERSGRGAKVDAVRIPLSPYFRDNAGVVIADPLQLALSGGEDYELLFTCKPEHRSGLESIARETETPLTVVGEITSDTTLTILSPDGRPVSTSCQGYRHF